ncbi:hypothetical protein [Aquimarina aggregata]|uniref:hypothetical protein n=1 Tax=Aquimarina aggregata TaxID=1642818 RepID=UPI00248F7679|nr:hypothetical protein [Aquimarina aggregata]
MKNKILIILVLAGMTGLKAQDQTVNGNLTVNGNILANKALLNDPNTTTNWNSIWQSGFYESLNAPNSPEASGWFWGINFNHRSNNPEYRYNGQIAIKNSATNPTMYFRSTGVDGNGIWSKILHNTGNQKINGDLSLNRLQLNDPNTTTNWNSIWQSGFYESLNAPNSPEASGWFWGINFNHRSNNPEYRYNGQIAIKNSATNPTMYFRSTGVDGNGVWSKILHNTGNQTMNGNLAVLGKIESKEIKVTNTPTADFVFEESYKLPSLDFIENYIKSEKHLPEIASAEKMKQDGVNIGDFQIQLLQKIEELTLYTIQQEKRIKTLESNNQSLHKENKQLHSLSQRLNEIEKLLKTNR